MSTEDIPLLTKSTYQRDFQTFYAGRVGCNNWEHRSKKGLLLLIRNGLLSDRKTGNSSVNNDTGIRAAQYDNAAFRAYDPPGAPIQCLSWLTIPPKRSFESHLLPAFSVQSNAGVREHVKLVVSGYEGVVQTTGTVIKALEPRGLGQPAVATFDDISLRRAGQYAIQVKCLSKPAINIVADCPLNVVPVSCPNYKLHSDYAGGNHMQLNFGMF